ncbi:unnamed protein product [Calypogeia fissa]
MGNSEIEAPLLVEQSHDLESGVSARISRVNEDYVVVPGSEAEAAEHVSNEEAAAQRKSSGWTAVLAVSICCIAAILFVSGAVVSHNSSMQQTPAGSIQIQVEKSAWRVEEDAANGGADNDLFYKASKTTYHFQPEKNWMNDPNAPMYYKGYYHFFYQYNPNAAVWGNISWGHAVSTDLIHWMYLEVALYPDQWYDIDGVWSGSATVLQDGTPVILYTGGRTENGVSIQSQSLAFPEDPSDPLLRKWRKADNNPIMDPPAGYKKDDFRDPTTAWLEEDGVWRLIIGTKLDNADGTKDGMSLLYSSTDFSNWDLASNYLYQVPGTGMWECVDFYPVNSRPKNGVEKVEHPTVGAENYLDEYKYVLKASLDTWAQDYYTIGTYSTETHEFTVDDPALDLGKGYRYDYGKFYASKSFYDPSTGRRIVWSWVNESDTEQDDIIKGWASVQAIPREIWLDDKTQKNLLTWPVQEVNNLRGAKASYQDITLLDGDVIKVEGGDGPQLDVEISFEKPDVSAVRNVNPEVFDCSQGGSAQKGIFGPFGLLVHTDSAQIEQTAVFFYITPHEDGQWSTRVCSDQSRSSLAMDLDKTVYGSYVTVLPTETELTMRVLVDHSIVETFVQGGRQAVTSRVYPTVALNENSHLFLFNNGSTPIKVNNMDVYQMTNVNMITI